MIVLFLSPGVARGRPEMLAKMAREVSVAGEAASKRDFRDRRSAVEKLISGPLKPSYEEVAMRRCPHRRAEHPQEVGTAVPAFAGKLFEADVAMKLGLDFLEHPLKTGLWERRSLAPTKAALVSDVVEPSDDRAHQGLAVQLSVRPAIAGFAGRKFNQGRKCMVGYAQVLIERLPEAHVFFLSEADGCGRVEDSGDNIISTMGSDRRQVARGPDRERSGPFDDARELPALILAFSVRRRAAPKKDVVLVQDLSAAVHWRG